MAEEEEYTLYRSTLIVLLFGPLVLFFGTAIIFGGSVAIDVGNAALLPLSGGVAATFSPTLWRAMTQGQYVRSTDVLGTGICVGFAGTFVARFFSIAWRASGQNPLWLDWTLWGSPIALVTGAALCHLVAPKALRGAVPPAHWVQIGVMVALGLAAFTLILYLL